MALRTFYQIVCIGTLSLLGIMTAFNVLGVLCGFNTFNAVETVSVRRVPCSESGIAEPKIGSCLTQLG